MNKIKKIAVVATMALSLVAPIGAMAADTVTDIEGNLSAAAETGAGYAKPTDPRVLASIYIRRALTVIGILFLCLMIYAGFLWMTAAGNEDNIDKAKGLIKAAVIGLVIVLASYSITYFVASLITARDSNYPEGSTTIFST